MHSPAAIEAAPSPEKRGSVPTRPADHTLLLQGRRYPEARDLRRTKYECCSNNTIAYNRRFFNVQQHSIRRRTAPWATGSTEVLKAALTGISGMLFVCFSALCRLAVQSTGHSQLRWPPSSRYSLGPAWAVCFQVFVLGFDQMQKRLNKA